jgi:hypothetical protein
LIARPLSSTFFEPGDTLPPPVSTRVSVVPRSCLRLAPSTSPVPRTTVVCSLAGVHILFKQRGAQITFRVFRSARENSTSGAHSPLPTNYQWSLQILASPTCNAGYLCCLQVGSTFMIADNFRPIPSVSAILTVEHGRFLEQSRSVTSQTPLGRSSACTQCKS